MQNKLQMILRLFMPVIISIVIGTIAIRMWEIDFNAIGISGADGNYVLAMFKSIEENGINGLFFNSCIGAPEIAALIELPVFDIVMAFEIWTLTRIFDFNMACYVFYILTFATSSAAMYIFLNRITERYWIKIILSISYAITPYHFYRSLGHISLSNYFVLPIGLYLAIMVYEETWNKGMPEVMRKSMGKKVIWILLTVLVALGNIYYSFFSILLVLVALIYKIIEKKTWKLLLNEAFILYELCFVFLLGIFPKLIYNIQFGKNAIAGIRSPSETELYGLKIIQLFLPPSYSKISLLKKINNGYTSVAFNVNENAYENMGLIACTGFVLICIWFMVTFIHKFEKTKFVCRMNIFAVFIIILVLYCTTGGIGTIVSYIVTPQLRCLNRGSIEIVTVCLSSIAVLGDRLEWDKKKNKLVIIGFLGVFCFTIYAEVDYFPTGCYTDSNQLASEYKAFFKSIENELEDKEMVYQLPMTFFPEVPPIYGMNDYSHFWGYLYTDNLRWSYGGVKGRNIVATDLFVDNGMSMEFLAGIKAAGFSGIYIDSYGYEDEGAEIIHYYCECLNQEPIFSADRRLYYFGIE